MRGDIFRFCMLSIRLIFNSSGTDIVEYLWNIFNKGQTNCESCDNVWCDLKEQRLIFTDFFMLVLFVIIVNVVVVVVGGGGGFLSWNSAFSNSSN